MTATPTFKLSRLREIGWAQWDPIGLDDSPDDEYDTYLMQAAARLWRGASEVEVSAYLVGVETNHMGLTVVADTNTRANKTVIAINAYISEIRC